MSSQNPDPQRSSWTPILTGLLAFAFGMAAVVFPANIMFGRILDVILGRAKPLSGSMTAVAALLALVAIDGLLNLFGAGMISQRATRLRGVGGVAVAIAAIFCPGMTAYVAVNLIGLWAILIGVLELDSARHSAKDQALLIIAAFASIAIGVGLMRWVIAGAVLVSAIVGIAAAARGVSLIVSGIHQQSSLVAKTNG